MLQMVASPQRTKVATPIVFGPPTGGLRLFDAIDAIPDGGALVLDNWVCQADTVRMRGGMRQRNTGLDGPVWHLTTYISGSLQRLFAISGNATHAIYDVTTTGVAPAPAVAGMTASDWSSVQFTTSGGTFLVLAGFGNARRLFDGAAWATTPAITGAPATGLSQVWAHANRLFFVEGGTTNVWYLGIDAIGGAATRFPLGGLFTKGGVVVAGASWTTDAGNSGLRSQCVFISSEGEIAVYDGPDPASWTLVGVYQVGKPLGINCFMKTGGDLAVLTEDGLIAMSQVVALDRAALANESVSKNIRPLWRAAVEGAGRQRWIIVRRDTAGYAIIMHPSNNAVVTRQFVVNLQTGAWSTFTGWAPVSLGEFNGQLMVGVANGRVMTGDDGGLDDGGVILASWIGPFKRDRAGRNMIAVQGRASMRSVERCPPKLTALFDYADALPVAPNACPPDVDPVWNSAIWNDARWKSMRVNRAVWQSLSGRGSAVAPCLQYTVGQTVTPSVEIVRVDMAVRAGEFVA